MTKSTKAKPAKKPAKKKAPPKPPGKPGRPTKFTPEVLQKLEEALCWGAKKGEAAVYAGVTPTLFSQYLHDHPEFTERIEALQARPSLLAKRNIFQKLKDGDLATSWEVLERGRVDGYTKPQEPAKGPGVQVNVTTPMAPGETEEGRKALEALHALFSGRTLPGPEHQGKG